MSRLREAFKSLINLLQRAFGSWKLSNCCSKFFNQERGGGGSRKEGLFSDGYTLDFKILHLISQVLYI